MKKLLNPLLAAAALFVMVSCGGEQKEETKIRFGSERSEVKGTPETEQLRAVSYGSNPKGELIYEETRYYDRQGNVVTYEYSDHVYDDSDYTQTYEYDDASRMISSNLKYHSSDEPYEIRYIWKNGLITKVENYQDGKLDSYYKYSYKGDREVSSSHHNSMGIKHDQTETTWEGNRVVKQVRKSEGSERVYTIEYPDELTEIMNINGFGAEDGDYSVQYTFTYDEDGKFVKIHSISEESEYETYYTYEYDEQGNWTKRTITDWDDDLVRIETREFTYYM